MPNSIIERKPASDGIIYASLPTNKTDANIAVQRR